MPNDSDNEDALKDLVVKQEIFYNNQWSFNKYNQKNFYFSWNDYTETSTITLFNLLILKIKLQEEDESVDRLISEIFGEDNNNDTGDVEHDDFGSFPEDDSNIWTEYFFH